MDSTLHSKSLKILDLEGFNPLRSGFVMYLICVSGYLATNYEVIQQPIFCVHPMS